MSRYNSLSSSITKCLHESIINKFSSCFYPGSVTNLRSDFGVITHPTSKAKNLYQHWNIETSSGTKAVLFLTMSLFEFEEGCPFDYIKVR